MCREKGLSVFLSLLLVFMLAGSFSVPVEASSWVYPAADMLGTVSRFTPADFSVSTKGGGALSGSTNYLTRTDDLVPNVFSVDIPSINFYTKQAIPDNSRVYISFKLRLWSQYNGMNTGSFQYSHLNFNLVNPYIFSDDVDVAVSQQNLQGTYDTMFAFNCSFDTRVSTNSIQFYDFKPYFTFNSGYKQAHKIYLYVESFRISYKQADDNPNADVLEAIRQNTANINNSVNNQTNVLNNAISNQTTSINNAISSQTTTIVNNITQQAEKQTDTLTNGYDNTGMDGSNSQLDGSLTGYDQKESEVTGQALSYMQGVTFTNISGNLQLLAAVSWCTAFLQSLFTNLGDWGTLVMVSLSLTFGLMLVGWFRFRK